MPAIMKVNACTVQALGSDPNNKGANALPGDVVVHTVDFFNGNPSLGVANILFQLPVGDAGMYQISGSVWDANMVFGTSRPQGWTLLVNGVARASGTLSGLVSRSQAQTFSFPTKLAAGDFVELDLYEAPNASAGYFVGVSLTIEPAGPVCVLNNVPSYDSLTGILTMKFALGTPLPATWNGWLISQTAVTPMWSQFTPATWPPVAKIEAQRVDESEITGILSTLTTTNQGLGCSSWIPWPAVSETR